MRIIDIKESGASNTLMWALSNGANVREDMPLTSLINDETFFLVTLSDVNFFELFRLTQMYRDKIRIISEHQAYIPTDDTLEELFPGNHEIEEKCISLADVAKHAITNFINLTSQMSSDDDIITPGAIRLFLPMITRKFDIQIPVSFIDFIESMNEEEGARLFTPDYPGTLKEIVEADVHGVKTLLSMGFIKATQILKYDTRYDQYLKSIKYMPLKSYQQGSKLYKLALLGFFKKDNISRGETRCSLFKANQPLITNALKRLARLNTPVELDFAIQIPIQYMQLIENSFGREVLTIQYESSMSSIIDGGLNYEDFKTYDVPVDIDTEEGQTAIQSHNNSIEAYRVRITEANQILLNTIPIMVNPENDVDITSVFAMLPSMYTAKAVITINSENIQKYIAHSDPVISAMFQEMQDVANGVNEDIRKMK